MQCSQCSRSLTVERSFRSPSKHSTRPQDAQRRIETVNASRATPLEERLGFGLALHVGTVLYGNIGVPTRLEFSVIGRAANEVCRMGGSDQTPRSPNSRLARVRRSGGDRLDRCR